MQLLKKFLVLLLIGAYHFAYSQLPLFHQVIHANYTHSPNLITKLPIGGYIIAGNVKINSHTELIVSKVDENLYTEWSKKYNIDNDLNTFDLLVSPSGSIYIQGYTRDENLVPGTNSSIFKSLLIKLSSNGSFEWGKGFNTPTYSEPIGIAYSKENTILSAIGYYTSSLGGYIPMITVVDTNGNVLDQYLYNNNENGYYTSTNYTSDQSFLIVGMRDSSFNQYDVGVTKLNSDLTVQWSKGYGRSGDDWNGLNGYSSFYQSIEVSDGYIIWCSSKVLSDSSPNVLVFKINKNGELLWAKTIGDSWNNYMNRSTPIYTDETQEVLFFIMNHNTTTKNKTSSFMKITTEGDLVFSQRYFDTEDDYHFAAVQDSTGYILLGRTATEDISSGTDQLISKVSSTGSSCDTSIQVNYSMTDVMDQMAEYDVNTTRTSLDITTEFTILTTNDLSADFDTTILCMKTDVKIQTQSKSVCSLQETWLTVDNGIAPYQWKNITDEPYSLGKHDSIAVTLLLNDSTYVVTDDYGNSDTLLLSLSLDDTCNKEIEIFNIITPNFDDKNDYFWIENISYFSSNELTIINDWGQELYHTTNYQNDWSGTELNAGIYYYILRINEKVYKGSLLLVK